METLLDLVRSGGERFADRPALIIRPSFRTRILTHGDLADDPVDGLVTGQRRPDEAELGHGIADTAADRFKRV